MPTKRDVGLDLIRLLSFSAIIVHHFIWVIWYTPAVPHSAVSVAWHIAEIFARSISFSGHTILFLSSFLIARAETQALKTWKVVIFTLIGWVAFCFFEWGENGDMFWVWDIYPLIALGLATGTLFSRSVGNKTKAAVVLFGLIGFLMTWVQFWTWPSLLSLDLQWRHWLIGECGDDLADWPILPWVGIIWCGYAIGNYARISNQNEAKPKFLSQWKKWEFLVWPPLLLIGGTQWGVFFNIVLGDQFACYSFRQPPLIFWGHFIFVVFFMRLVLVKQINDWLSKFKIVRFIANLEISKHFGFAYLVHYCLLRMMTRIPLNEDQTGATFSFLLLLSVLPLTEGILRLALVAIKALAKPTRLKN